jgi:hypothetical protein
VLTRVLRGQARETEQRFTASFTIGRGEECDLQLLDAGVEQKHVQVTFDGVRCWARNLAHDATYIDGAEFEMVRVQTSAELELGKGGPIVSLTLQEAAGVPIPLFSKPGGTNDARSRELAAGHTPRARTPTVFTSVEQVIARLRPSSAPAGQQTIILRQAVNKVLEDSSRKYKVLIAVAAVLVLGAGAVIGYQQQKLKALRATAEKLFYAAKAEELETSRLEELVLLNSNPREVAQLKERRAKFAQLEREYDSFVRELRVYAKASQEEQVVLRVVRLFGECEVNVPRGFLGEVERFVKKWKSSDRLATTLHKAQLRGYPAEIARIFAASNLPPQYLFLALQESNLDERAVGPATQYGFAKGMWQFIALTGKQYGLRIGPLQGQRLYDAQDERFEWQKATAAAAHYIRDLTDAEAQGSGLLVLASYNWGEHNIRGIIQKLPENPQERNFWRLLADKRVPRETYDYVLSIVSAAVICEEPERFGFRGDCPRTYH